MNELALVSVGASTWSLNVPLLANFSFVILVGLCLLIQLMDSMGVGALVIEFTDSSCHEIFAKLSLVIKPEVLDILYHGFSRGEIHLLFLSILSEIEPNTSLGTAQIHQIKIGIRESLIKACLRLLVLLCLVDKNLVDLVKLTIFDDILCYIVLFLLRRQRIEVRTLACKVKSPTDAANLPHVVITKHFRLIEILFLL